MNRIVTLSSELIPALMPEKLTSLSSLASPVLSLLPSESPDPDATRSVPELIESRGFTAETYDIHTPDGFVLVLHRIVNPHAHKYGHKGRPVLLGHGIAAHSGHWLINSSDGHLEEWPHSHDTTLDTTVDTNQNDPTTSQVESDQCSSSAYSSMVSYLKKKERKQHKRTGNNLGFVLANSG